MQDTLPANRRPQALPRLAAIPVPALHQRAVNGRPPVMPVVVQQRPAPQQMPSQVQPQMQRPMPPPPGMFPPHPPRGIIPPQLLRPVVVSDTRAESQTENDIRDQLSDYVIFRFEKVEPHDEYDSEGEEVRATWDNCIRRRVADVDKTDTQREIRRLNKEDAKKGKTLVAKQNDLGPKGHNQLDKAHRELLSEERDERFQIVLAQVDSILKPVVMKHERVTRHRRGTKRKIRQKKRYERTSITAYFKRCPKPNQPPSELARQIVLERQQFRQRQEQQQFEIMRLRQRQMQEQQMPPPPPPHAMPQPRPGPMPNPPGGHMSRPQAMPMHQHNVSHDAGRPRTPIQVILEPSGKGRHHKADRSRSSGSSEYSDKGSNSETFSDSTLVTVPSRSSDSYKGKKDHGHKRRSLRYLEKAENFGVEIHPARRHRISEGKSYIVTGSGTRLPIPHVPRPRREAAIPVGNLEQIRAAAYHAGRNDQKAVYRQLHGETGSLDTASKRYHPRYVVQPEVIIDRGSPTRIRHVTTSEVNRHLDDSFQRLRLDRETRHDEELDDLLLRRRREAIIREEEQIMRDIDAQELQERRRNLPSPMLNPFTPLSRRGTSSAYEFERGHRH